MKSPIIWFGGKGKFVKNLLPYTKVDHLTYVEVFGGGGSLLFAKDLSKIEVYNDLDSGLVNLFRVLRDETKFKEFRKLVELTPCSREEFNYHKEKYKNKDWKNDIEHAYLFFIIARMSFGGIFGSGWGFVVTQSNRNMSSQVSRYLSSIDNLPNVADRLKTVQVEQNDFRKIIKTYDRSTALFYLDPPYISSTRKAGGYSHEMTDEDHRELVNLLLNIKGLAFLSCYYSDIYDPLIEAGWKRFDKDTVCHAAGKTVNSKLQGRGSALKHQKRIETILSNFEPGSMKWE